MFKKSILLFVFTGAMLLAACSKQPLYPAPPIKGAEAAIDLKTLTPEIPKYFTYHYRGRRVNFFVIKTGDKVLSFLDACASCYPRKLGFRFDNGYFTCRACNVRYSVSEIEKGIGSCFPIRIRGDVRDGEYFLPVSVLENSADKF